MFQTEVAISKVCMNGCLFYCFVHCFVGESNPPEVWHFVRSLNQNWAHFAEFLGFPSRLICDIQSAWHHDPKAQIKSFMRMNLIPDCGDEKIRAIIHQITPHMPVCRDPSISTKGWLLTVV